MQEAPSVKRAKRRRYSNADNDYRNLFAMVEAAEGGNLEMVKLLVEEEPTAGYAVVDFDSSSTALWLAAQNGHLEVVRFLVNEAQADVNKANNIGRTPVYVAAQEGHLEVVRFLASEAQADVSKAANGGFTPVLVAADMGHLEVIRFLASETQADVNEARTTHGSTPVYVAASQGHLELVRFLVHEAQADVNSGMPDTGATPLYVAAQEGHLAVARFLVSEAHANVDMALTAKHSEYTPLQIAASGGHLDLVRYLVSAQADVNKGSRNGATALMMAVSYGYSDIVRFLIQAGNTNLHVLDHDGHNALDDASLGMHVEICSRLLVAGLAIRHPQDFQHRLMFTTQVLDWIAERLACHHRFMTVVLFGMHQCSGTALSRIGGVLEVRVRIAHFLDIQTGSDLRHLRAASTALRQTISINADDIEWIHQYSSDEDDDEFISEDDVILEDDDDGDDDGNPGEDHGDVEAEDQDDQAWA